MNCGRGKGPRVDLSSGVNRSCFGGVCGGWKWVGAGCYPRNVTCHGISGAWLPAAEVCRLGLYAGASSKKSAVRSSSSSSPYIPPLSFALRSPDCLTECPSGCCPEENWFCCPDNIYCAATAEDCPGTPCSCGVLDNNPSPSENELPAKCRETCCCPNDEGTPSNFKNLPWCSGVLCDGAGVLSVSSAPLFEPGVCVGTECPAGCCPGENWFCCPDNIYCAATAQNCPSVESLDGSPTTIAGVEIDPGRYFDVLSPPMQAFSGITGGQFVVPEWLGYNLAVYIDSSGFKSAEWVAPRQILNFQSTILLGYQPIGKQTPGVLPPPAFSVEYVDNEQIGPVYILTVDPVEGATGYVFRFNGVAIRPSRIGPAPATQNGYPELAEGQYLYTDDISGQAVTAAAFNSQDALSVTAATVNSQGTGGFSDPVVVSESCIDGGCGSTPDECELNEDCDSCCPPEWSPTPKYDEFGTVPGVGGCCPPWAPYDSDSRTCGGSTPSGTFQGYCIDGKCECEIRGSWCEESDSCEEADGCDECKEGTQSEYESLGESASNWTPWGKCNELFQSSEGVLEAQAPPKKVADKCKYWVCFKDQDEIGIVNGKKYTYKVNRCGWRERSWGNYINYLTQGYNTKKECCEACDCETTGACCQWNTADPTQAACMNTSEKACNETTPTPGWSRSFLGVGSTCANCRRVTGSPDNPLPPIPPTPPPPPPPPPSSTTSPPPSSSSVSDSSSSSSSSKPCTLGSCEVLNDNTNPTEEELPAACQVPCCCPQSGGGIPAFSNFQFCDGFDYKNNCDGVVGPSI